MRTALHVDTFVEPTDFDQHTGNTAKYAKSMHMLVVKLNTTVDFVFNTTMYFLHAHM